MHFAPLCTIAPCTLTSFCTFTPPYTKYYPPLWPVLTTLQHSALLHPHLHFWIHLHYCTIIPCCTTVALLSHVSTSHKLLRGESFPAITWCKTERWSCQNVKLAKKLIAPCVTEKRLSQLVRIFLDAFFCPLTMGRLTNSRKKFGERQQNWAQKTEGAKIWIAKMSKQFLDHSGQNIRKCFSARWGPLRWPLPGPCEPNFHTPKSVKCQFCGGKISKHLNKMLSMFFF